MKDLKNIIVILLVFVILLQLIQLYTKYTKDTNEDYEEMIGMIATNLNSQDVVDLKDSNMESVAIFSDLLGNLVLPSLSPQMS